MGKNDSIVTTTLCKISIIVNQQVSTKQGNSLQKQSRKQTVTSKIYRHKHEQTNKMKKKKEKKKEKKKRRKKKKKKKRRSSPLHTHGRLDRVLKKSEVCFLCIAYAVSWSQTPFLSQYVLSQIDASPWDNRHAWFGVKHKSPPLLSLAPVCSYLGPLVFELRSLG